MFYQLIWNYENYFYEKVTFTEKADFLYYENLEPYGMVENFLSAKVLQISLPLTYLLDCLLDASPLIWLKDIKMLTKITSNTLIVH